MREIARETVEARRQRVRAAILKKGNVIKKEWIEPDERKNDYIFEFADGNRQILYELLPSPPKETEQNYLFAETQALELMALFSRKKNKRLAECVATHLCNFSRPAIQRAFRNAEVECERFPAIKRLLEWCIEEAPAMNKTQEFEEPL